MMKEKQFDKDSQIKIIKDSLKQINSEEILKIIFLIKKQYLQYSQIQYSQKDNNSILLSAFSHSIKQKVVLEVYKQKSEESCDIQNDQSISQFQVVTEDEYLQAIKNNNQKQKGEKKLIFIFKQIDLQEEEQISDSYEQEVFQEQTLSEIKGKYEEIKNLSIKALSEAFQTLSTKIKPWIVNFLSFLFVFKLKREISKCQNLVKLTIDLSLDEIGSKGASSLCQGISCCQRLKFLHLNLKDNFVGPEGGIRLGQGLYQLKELKQLILNLNYNHVGKSGIFEIGTAISNLRQLKKLQLSLECNHIEADGTSNLGICIAKCQKITDLFLELRWNQINCQSVQVLFQELSHLPQLETLYADLSENLIFSNGLDSLSYNLNQFISLRNLSLKINQNPITAEGIISLRKNLRKLTNLNSLCINLIKIGVDEDEIIVYNLRYIIKIKRLVQCSIVSF